MSLPVFQATVVNESGDIIPSATITVLDEATGLGLTVYSDRNGTVPLGTNGVFTAGTDGFAQFFAPAGNYRVKAEQAASGFERTWDFVAMVGSTAFTETGADPENVPLNSDLPDFGTAADKDVQTSPSDATAGAVLNNETTHIGGEVNYTGANLNPNDFKCSSADARFFMGFAVTASLAVFFAPVSFNAKPSSISVTGTFLVKDAAASTVTGGAGITPVLDSASSFKNALLVVSGLSGMTVGENLQLTSTDATSRILVNI